jgi:type II secretory pathway pseudopilin PulG
MNTENTSDKRRATSGGFTLAEAMMATVVLGIAAAGVLLPFTSGAKVRAEGMRMTLAAKLASDLMEEIIRTPSKQVDGYSYIEEQGQIKDSSDSIFTDPIYANFSRGASCVKVDVPVSDGVYTEGVEFILVTVWVKYNGREIVSIKRLISK